MKKILAVLTVLSLLFTVQFQAYAAVGWPTYTLESNVPATRDETVTVPITVSNNPGFTSVGFVVTYNPNVLEIVSVSQATAAMPLNPQFALTSTPGSQWIHLINTNLIDWSGNGVVVNIDFKVKSNAPNGSTPIYLAFTSSPDGTPSNANSNILTDARVFSGSVNVSDEDSNAVKYPVTYNLNGGTGITPTETDKAEGQTFQAMSVLGIIAPTGKQFKEWNTSPNGSATWYWPGETITMPAYALTLYAIWEDIPAQAQNNDTNNNTSTDTSNTQDNTGSDSSNATPGVSDTGGSAGGGTNSEWLPQAGLLYWPIPVLAVFGALMLIPCIMLLRSKK